MPCLVISFNKDLYLPINNNKDVKKTVAKHLPLFYATTKMSKNNNPYILSFLIIGAYSCKCKCTNKNKNNPKTTAKNSLFYYIVTNKPDGNNFFILVLLTKSVCSCKSKHANTKIKDNGQNKTLSHPCTIEHQHL